MGKITDAGERMLAAREEMIDRNLKSVEAHELTDGQMVAVCVLATAAALVEMTGVAPKQAGEALQTSVRRYLADVKSLVG